MKRFKTKNIAATIQKYAQQNNNSPLEYTFSINEVETYIKAIGDESFKLYNEDTLYYYDNPQKMINEHVKIKQIYTITLKHTPKRILKLNYSLDFSPNTLHPSLILHPESMIPYQKHQPKEIYFLLAQEFNAIKAANGILINLFDTQMKEKLKAFVKHLYAGKFVKKIKIPLFHGIDPEITRSSKLLMRFLEKESKLKVVEVVEGETLVEYIKPVFGSNGFNALGDIVDATILKNMDDLKCKIDTNTIEIIEQEDRRIYKSKVKGFVHLDANEFYIDNKIHVNSLSRVQEKIAKEEANNIEVVIAQHDTSLDSLGEGVELVSEKIHIHGHIGAKSIIKAVHLTIDGATHKDSTQEAKFARINRHKGKLRCHSAQIELLEGGEVYATKVEIKNSLGGTIYAEDVTIHHVKHNLKVYASSSIHIKLVSGEDNLFKISYKDVPTLVAKIEFLTQEIEDWKYKLEGAKKHSLAKVPLIQEKIASIKAHQEELMESAMHAKITIEEPLRGINTVVFALKNGEELLFKTDAMAYEPFYLVASQENITLHPTNKKISLT